MDICVQIQCSGCNALELFLNNHIDIIDIISILGSKIIQYYHSYNYYVVNEKGFVAFEVIKLSSLPQGQTTEFKK